MANTSAPTRAKRMKPVRHMRPDGSTADGDVIRPGDRFIMVSGRITTPYPRQKSPKYNVRWLIDNAVAEAIANRDDFNLTPFSRISATAPSMADLESLTMYLFDYQPVDAIRLSANSRLVA